MTDLLGVQPFDASLMSVTSSFRNGPRCTRSDLSRRPVGSECTTTGTFTPYSTSLPPLQRKRRLSTVEYPQHTKKRILNVNEISCARSIQALSTCRMLAPESILNDPTFSSSLATSWMVMWRQLLYPTETDYVDSGTSLLNGFVDVMAHKSWFITSKRTSVSYPMISWPFATSSSLSEMVRKARETEKKESVVCTKTIRLYPNKHQTKKFKKWFGVYRFIYNNCIDVHSRYKTVWAKRQYLINNGCFLKEMCPWLKEYPYDVMDEAIRDYHKALKSNFAKQKLNPGMVFEIKYKTRKSMSDSVNLPKKHWRNGRPFPKWFGTPDKAPIPTGEPVILTKDCRIVFKRGIRRYFITQQTSTPTEEILENQEVKICSIDPGVRTFATSYATDGTEMYHGHEASKALRVIQRRIDFLDSIAARNKKKRKGIRRRQATLRYKMKCQVDQLHYSTIKELLKNDVVFLPKFSTSQMVKRTSRHIPRAVARSMLGLRHFEFRQRLLHKGELKNKKVFVVDEHYTTRTCSACLNESNQVGSVFHCGYCGVSLSRDLNAAKNIMLKNASVLLKWMSAVLPLSAVSEPAQC